MVSPRSAIRDNDGGRCIMLFPKRRPPFLVAMLRYATYTRHVQSCYLFLLFVATSSTGLFRFRGSLLLSHDCCLLFFGSGELGARLGVFGFLGGERWDVRYLDDHD